MFCLLLQLWLLFCPWVWLLVFLCVFFFLGLLWQFLTPLSFMRLRNVIQSLSPDLAAVLGKDELCLWYKTWVGRGQGRLLYLGHVF